MQDERCEKFLEFLEIIRRLRAPDGCPWDREQTHESLKSYVIEEAYELVEAIDSGDDARIKEELGDVLLQIALHSQIASEQGAFDFGDVLEVISRKMIYRHPHVFGETEASTAEQVLQNWEDLKLKENNKKNRSVLSGVPAALPALTKALRIQEKVSGVGFDWDNKEEVWNKLDEELGEVKEVLEENPGDPDKQKLEEEFGDLLFTVINAARLYGVEPEIALERTNLKFMRRFQEMEERIRNNGKTLKESSLDEMEEEWNRAKENDE